MNCENENYLWRSRAIVCGFEKTKNIDLDNQVRKRWFGLASWGTYGMNEAKLHDQEAKGQLLKAGNWGTVSRVR